MRCPQCFAPIPEGSSFCFDCGRRVRSDYQEPWEWGESSHRCSPTGDAKDHQKQQRAQRIQQSRQGPEARPRPVAARPTAARPVSERPPAARPAAKAHTSRPVRLAANQNRKRFDGKKKTENLIWVIIAIAILLFTILGGEL